VLLQYLEFWAFVCPRRWSQASSVNNVSLGQGHCHVQPAKTSYKKCIIS
jgi:hypothetical protein